MTIGLPSPATEPAPNDPSKSRATPISPLAFAPVGDGVSVVALYETQFEPSLCHPDELALLRGNVVSKRRNEFSLGRCAARLALQNSGYKTFSPLLQKVGREPAWPTGFVGSITHCGKWAIAAAAKADSVHSIGIDLEDSSAILVDEMIDLVCTEAERTLMFGTRSPKQELAAVFSAKEAAYKALFPICHKFFAFHAIELLWLPERCIFIGTLREELAADFPPGYCLTIGCQHHADFVFTHAVVRN
ncbi:MAG TPA: 4'-phosphopantetheinyl transferase superfamily protein [Candidatus Aquilonibacter sp.]|nr:4'-phosphopantetheinyl transferase superfamily protein [Candidatus Aquilonibacter sp.]